MGGRERTWYAKRGSGEPLVLPHGVLADSRFSEQNIDPLAERFWVLTPDQRGHGRTPDVPAVGEPVHLAGRRNGAFVALLIALRRPELARRLVLVSGSFHRDGSIAGSAEFDVDAAVEALGASHGEVSPDGEEHLRVVVRWPSWNASSRLSPRRSCGRSRPEPSSCTAT